MRNFNFWDYGAVVIDKYGNVETEAVERYIGYDDHHGSATKRALSRLGINEIDGTMGVEVAQSACKLGIVTLHIYAPSLFAYSSANITPLQFEAIYSLLISRTDFDFILFNNEKSLDFNKMEHFLEYLRNIVDLDISDGILR